VVDYLPVRAATLRYQAGGGGWQSLTMTQVGEGYQVTIPGADVTLAGLAYYIEASDGVSTATYPAADPVNSPQTITVSPRPAPAAVSDLGGDLAGDQLTLTWSPVTQDVNGGAITVDHYVIYRRAGEPYFIPTPTDLIASDVTGTSYIDTVAAGGDYFYGVVAVDSHDGVSSVSNRLGVFSFSLTPGSGS